MNIQLDTSRANLEALRAAAFGNTAGAVRAGGAETAILGSASLKVTNRPADLDKLAALLINESEQARYNSIIGVLLNAFDVVKNINEEAAADDEKTLEEIETVTKEKDGVDRKLSEAEKRLTQAESDVRRAENALEGAREKLDRFMATYDPSNADGAAEKAELEKAVASAQADLNSAVSSRNAARSERDGYANQSSRLSDRRDALCGDLSDESHRALVSALKLGIDDFNHLFAPFAEEEAEAAGSKPLSDMTVSELIQFVTDRQNEMRDDIESKRENGI